MSDCPYRGREREPVEEPVNDQEPVEDSKDNQNDGESVEDSVDSKEPVDVNPIENQVG